MAGAISGYSSNLFSHLVPVSPAEVIHTVRDPSKWPPVLPVAMSALDQYQQSPPTCTQIDSSLESGPIQKIAHNC